ncbi:MAG: ABC transporter ATP-binding protein [Gemmatimonadales bacterium]
MPTPLLQLTHLTKRFPNGAVAVDDISLEVAAGEFLTLLGASGSGKTTTLRMIAGFEHPTSGDILMDGRPLTLLPPFKRELNTVFQQYALFPHMSVRDNVGYGLRMRRVARAEIATRVAEALEMVQLGPFGDRAPRQLSGGQQQRVALARALVNRPRVLLLDEPLGALDLKLRKEMQLELKHLNRQLGITFLYVTHDQEEALTMSDRIALMRNGRIEQLSAPREMYEQPASRYVADFIGETNLLSGKTAKTWIAIRPEHIRPAAANDGPVRLEVTVKDVVFTGAVTRVHTQTGQGEPLVLHWPVGAPSPAAESRLTVTWDEERATSVGE